MSELEFETLYDKASESILNAGQGASTSLLVNDADIGDPTHYTNYIEESLIYAPVEGYKRARERYVFRDYRRFAFGSLQLPARQITYNITSDFGLIDNQSLSLSLPVNTSANVTLPRGWGYLLVDLVQITISGKTLTLTGNQLIHWLYHICQNQGDFDAMWSAGGAARTGTWTAGQPTAQVLLPLPWNVPNMPAFDTALLQGGSINLVLSLKGMTDIAGGSGAAAIANSLNTGSWVTRTGSYTLDSRESLLTEQTVFKLRGINLSYTTIFEFYQSDAFISSATSSTSDSTLQLTSFDRSKPLTGIVVTAILSSEVRPAGGLPVNSSAFVELTNITLKYLSEPYIQTEGSEYELQRVRIANGKATYIPSLFYSGGAVAPYTSTNLQNPVYRFIFSRYDRPELLEPGVPGVNAMTFSFRTPTTANHDIYISYLYDYGEMFDMYGFKFV